MRIGERVLELRKVKDMTQTELATAAGVNRVTIARLETGDQKTASWETVKRLAVCFGLTVDEFLRGVEYRDSDRKGQFEATAG